MHISFTSERLSQFDLTEWFENVAYGVIGVTAVMLLANLLAPVSRHLSFAEAAGVWYLSGLVFGLRK